MPSKKEQKLALLSFPYGSNDMILPYATAIKVAALLEEAEALVNDYRDEDVNIGHSAFTLTPYQNEKYLGIKKAQMLGITYKEYLEKKEERLNAKQEPTISED